MCRIFGISYGPKGPEGEELSPTELAQIMFPALIKRGPHAWGWMANVEGEVLTHKQPGRCDVPETIASMELPDSPKWVVGHTRWATTGDPEDNRNNHPIRHGNVIGVHNGVLRNYEPILSVTGREVKGTEVDSEAIFAAVNKWGHRAGLNKIMGDMVTVYVHDDKPETLHIAKSIGRPLFFGKTEAGSTLFASEEQALEATGIVLPDSITELRSYELHRLRGGEVKSRVRYRTEVHSFSQQKAPSNGKHFSVGRTRRRMGHAQEEIMKAQRFIDLERMKMAVIKETGLNQFSYNSTVKSIAERKGEPDWGLMADSGSVVFIGNGMWVTIDEFVVEMKYELSRARVR